MAEIEIRDKIVSTTNSLQQLLGPVKIQLETVARVVPRYLSLETTFFSYGLCFLVHYERNDYCLVWNAHRWDLPARHFCVISVR